MTHPCWNCGALIASRAACPLCSAHYDHAASIRLADISTLEDDVRANLGRVARLANSSLKHGDHELSIAASASEKKISELLSAIGEMRKAVKRDVTVRLAAASGPKLKAVP